MTDESSGAELLRRAFLTGVVVPAVITLVVLAFAFNAVYDHLDALSSAVVAVSPGIGLPVAGATSASSRSRSRPRSCPWPQSPSWARRPSPRGTASAERPRGETGSETR